MMNKIILTMLVCMMLAITSCSLIQNFPGSTPTGDVVLENPFVFVTNTTNETTDEVPENDSEVIVISTEDEVEENTEIIDVEPELDENDNLVLTTITATEGDLISLNDIIAQDPDGDSVEYTYSDLFTETGLWQTNDGDEGKYLVTIEATDGLLTTSELIQIEVLPSNKGPVIECPTEVTVAEGETLDLDCLIFDREGDEVTYQLNGFLQDFVQDINYEDAGVYTVVVSATDGTKTTLHEIELTVEDTNRLPLVASLDPITVEEEQDVVIEISASDADGDDVTVDYPVLFDENGVWQTQRGDAGNYELEAIVSDGKNDVTVPVTILVTKKNSAPIISVLTDIVVNEGEVIDLELDIFDEDEEEITLTIEGFMTEETYQTTYDDAGNYQVTITATDGKDSATETVDITIVNVNRPPVFVLK